MCILYLYKNAFYPSHPKFSSLQYPFANSVLPPTNYPLYLPNYIEASVRMARRVLLKLNRPFGEAKTTMARTGLHRSRKVRYCTVPAELTPKQAKTPLR